VKAYRFSAWQTKPELRDVPIPEPGPGEVLLKIAGSGVCHSDLHVMEWPEGVNDWDIPFTFGHENTGWVEAIGHGVGGLEIGEAVAVYGAWGCGRCANCRQGFENYCLDPPRGLGGGLGRDGGMAEYMLVPSARWLLALGDLDPREAAPLPDAGLTPYHAIKRSLRLLAPGSTAVVIGAGGLGHMAIQILKALSPARVVAVDTAADKLALAVEDGADDVVPAGAEAEVAIREITRGRGAQLVLDFVGADATMALGAKVAGVQGHLTIVGLAMGTLAFDFRTVPWECALAATYWGALPELAEVIALAQAGKVRSRVEYFPLERADEAYERMRAGTLEGRAVITPSG
jgi:propanol-preferring alcohol dehydrogenase